MDETVRIVDEEVVKDALEQFKNVGSNEDCLRQVFQVFEIYGLGHACLQRGSHHNAGINSMWRQVPDDVTELCKILTASGSHPAEKVAKGRQFPFNLFDFRHLFSKNIHSEQLFEAFISNNIQQVYGLPIHTQNETFVFVVGREGSPIHLSELLALQAICINAANQMLDLEKRPCEAGKQRKLTIGDCDILVAISQGASSSEVAEKLGYSENTIGLMHRQIMVKLGANNISHAIVLALIEGEISLSDCIAMKRLSRAH